MTADALAETLNFRRDSLSGWKTVSAAAWRWRLRPDMADVLQDHPVLKPGEAPLSPGTVIKHGPHRTVRRLEVSGREFYFKQFHLPDWRTRIRHLLRGNQARWEWSRFQLAVHHEIPTADVVAVGHDTSWGGASGLITRGLSSAVSLDQWIENPTSEFRIACRRRLAELLGGLTGRMHRQGVTHLDFHAGNILIRRDAEDWNVWIVDLSPMRFGPAPSSLAARGQNLGRLRHSLLRHVSRTDEAVFFEAYWKEIGSPADHQRAKRQAVMRELSERCEAVARTCWEQMDRKWARGNRKTILIETPTVRCRGLAELGRPLLAQLCETPERIFEASTSRMRLADQLVLIQHHRSSSNAARRGWETGHALRRRLIAAPVPVFLLEQDRPEGVLEVLAVAEEPGWQPLAALFSSEFGLLSTAMRSEIGSRVVDLLRRFHDLGFHSERLSLSALEFRSQKERWQVRFASLGDIDQPAEVSRSRRLAELRSLASDISARTEIPLTQWLRWLRRYLQRLEPHRWKADWHAAAPIVSSPGTRRAA